MLKNLIVPLVALIALTGCQAAPTTAPTMNLEASDEDSYSVLASKTSTPADEKPATMKVKIALDTTTYETTPQKAVVADVERLVISIREVDGTMTKTLPRTKLANAAKGTDLVASVTPGKVVVIGQAFNAKGKLLGSDQLTITAITRKSFNAPLTLRLKAPLEPAPAAKKAPAPKSLCS